MTADPTEETGLRLWAQAPHLRLLLTHLAGRAIRDRVDLDDLLQEIYLRALTAAGLPPAEPGEQPLRRFLGHVARNVVVDAARHLRAAKRDRQPLRLSCSGTGPDSLRASALLAATAGPATRVQGREAEAALRARFESLAPEHRRVIGLRQFEGLSAREAARRMGRSEVAIHSLYRRALAAWDVT